MEAIIVAVFLFLFAVFVLYNIVTSIRVIGIWYFGDYINKYLLIAKIDPLYRAPLQKYSIYYNQLNAANQTIFEKRVQKFINQKQFIARDMDRVTDEMKALIAGSAIQLTFGYPSVYFAHFKRILIYPDDYYSTISQKYHKGEVNMGGLIVLSWGNFVEGYIDHKDGKNLGLHEMAHALRLENAISNKEYGFLDDKTMKRWTSLCYQEIVKMYEGKSDFFRSYATANSEEFFAVAVENFFERPKEFLSWNPEMYEVLSQILNQDPLKIGKLG